MDEINSIGKNKGTKVLRNIIIVMLLLIIILLIVFVALYFCTDLLKSDKQLFFKYASELVEAEEGKENKIEAFYNKKQQMPFENKGEFDFTADLGEDSNDQIDIANDFYINFSGKTDKVNNKSEQNIELKYSNDVSWPLIYRQDNDVYGIQTDYVSSKYVAVENKNLKEFAEKMGITDTSSIPDKIEIPENMNSLQYTEEEIKILQEKYMVILEEKLRDDQFKSEKDSDGTTRYILTMTNEELRNLIVALLNKLKTDDITLGKINSILKNQDLYIENESIDSKDIDSIIDSINEKDIAEGEIQFIVTQKDSKSTSLTVSQNENNIQLTKNIQEDKENFIVSINLNISGESITAYFSMDYSGLKELNNVSENYELGFEVQDADEKNSMKYTYQLKNTVNFVDSINIEGLNEENAMILNNYKDEEVQNFIGQLSQRISDVNGEQMRKIGFNYGNPMVFAIPSISMFINNQALNIVTKNDISNQEILSFNNKFLMYGGQQKGSIVKSLIQEVDSNNIDELQVEIEFSGLGLIRDEDLSLAGEYINDSNTYEISFEYDDVDRINKIIIAGEFDNL